MRIQEFGVVTDGCTRLGDEFNPFADANRDPYQSYYQGWSGPSIWDNIGTIDNITSDNSGNASIRQNSLEQDLAGDDSLIGRSIALYEKDDDTVLGCCVIAVDTYRSYEQAPVVP